MIHIGTMAVPDAALYATGAVAALLVIVLLVRAVRQMSMSDQAANAFYLVAVVATLVSINTSWRYFGEILKITSVAERSVMFGIIEITLVACGVSMRAGVRSESKKPGPAQPLAWAICAAAGYMAVQVSGASIGAARVVLGPVLAIVALHLALGIEIRTQHTQSSGTWSRIGREIRERLLSRIGLADDERDALARTRDRAVTRAARLATSRVPFRKRRLARALRASGVALDQDARGRMLAQVATFRHLDSLLSIELPSPWATVVDDDQDHAPDDARELVEIERASALPAAPVSPAGVPADLTEMTSTAAVAWAHVALGSVPASKIRAWLAEQGIEVSEALIYKVRRIARQLGTDVSALISTTGEYPALAVVPSDSSEPAA